MLKEVISRVNLIIAVEGSRKISRENLEFMFAKYQLSEEDKEAVLTYCKENRITVFQESSVPINTRPNVQESREDEESAKTGPATKAKSDSNAQPAKKGGFFARLFGKS